MKLLVFARSPRGGSWNGTFDSRGGLAADHAKASVQAVVDQVCGAMLEQLGYCLDLRRDGAADGQYELVATPH